MMIRALSTISALALATLLTTPLSAQPAGPVAMAKSPAAENLAAAETFLAKNAKVKGRKVTKSGLQYQILKAGTGLKPARIDTVSVTYKGSLLSGQVFDQTSGDPAKFRVSQVIPGWTEALQMMPAGSKWRLWIHPKLAYGERGFDPVIPPNSLLIFDVELLAVERAVQP